MIIIFITLFSLAVLADCSSLSNSTVITTTSNNLLANRTGIENQTNKIGNEIINKTVSELAGNNSQIINEDETTEDTVTITTSMEEGGGSTTSSSVDNEGEDEEEEEEELDDNESLPGFGNSTDFLATTTTTAPLTTNLTDDTILFANASESSSVPFVDWRSKFNVTTMTKNATNTTIDERKQAAILRRKNLKMLLEYLRTKDVNRLVLDIEMSERYKKVAAVLKNTLNTLLQALFVDYKDD